MFIQGDDVSLVVIDEFGYIGNDSFLIIDNASAKWRNFYLFSAFFTMFLWWWVIHN